jgi:hypothetical protein
MSDSNYLDDQVSQTTNEAKSWVADLPWYVKLGIPVVGIIGILAAGGAVVNSIINPDSPNLNVEQMEIVNKAGKDFFAGQRANIGGVERAGSLLSCAAFDSPPRDYNVTCTGNIPVEVQGVNGKPDTWKNQRVEANCSVPRKTLLTPWGPSGCKAK